MNPPANNTAARAPPDRALVEAFAAIVRDIDATITHWRNRGVRAEDIGGQMRCHHKWAAIRRKMIAVSIPAREVPSESAMIALIGCRKRARLTQEHVATRIGVSRRRLSHYENGLRTPPVEILAAWRSAVGLRPKTAQRAA